MSALRDLEPILRRSNVTTHLRQIRKEIDRIKTKNKWSPSEQEELAELERAQAELKSRFIFLIVDNTQTCTSSAIPKLKD